MCYKQEIEIKNFWYTDILVMPMVITIVTTVNEAGVVNAAPYSLVMPYDIMDTNPQIIIGLRKQSHTFNNILETKEFVINFPTASHLNEIMELSRFHPAGVNEIELTMLTEVPSSRVRPPSIHECPQHIECTLAKVIETDHVQGRIVGNVVSIRMDKNLVTMERQKRIEHLNLPIYMGDEKKNTFHYRLTHKPTVMKLNPVVKDQTEHAIITTMPWETEALEALNKTPDFVRSLVIDMLEDLSKKEGKSKVTYSFFLEMLKEYAPPSVLEEFGL